MHEARQKQGSVETYLGKCLSCVHELHALAVEEHWDYQACDNEWQWGYILQASHLCDFSCDYPKQVFGTAVKMGACPTCNIPCDELILASEYLLCDLEKILEALNTLDSSPTAYAAACEDTGIKSIYHPFWEGLPYTNIFQAISPDVLDQFYQGIIKHLIAWLTKCVGEAKIDACCQHLPPNHNICLFMSGISNLSHITRKEHDLFSCSLLMCSFLTTFLLLPS
jgi:hypothetical protein